MPRPLSEPRVFRPLFDLGVKAVLFDLDGTLSNIPPLCITALP
jgi:hypothetical protein